MDTRERLIIPSLQPTKMFEFNCGRVTKKWSGVVKVVVKVDCLKIVVGMELDGICKEVLMCCCINQQVGASRDLNCELEKWTDVCVWGLLSIDGGNTHL